MLSVASPINPLVQCKQTLCGEQIIEPIQRIPARIVNPVIRSCEYALTVGLALAFFCKVVLDVELGNEHCTDQRGGGKEGC